MHMYASTWMKLIRTTKRRQCFRKSNNVFQNFDAFKRVHTEWTIGKMRNKMGTEWFLLTIANRKVSLSILFAYYFKFDFLSSNLQFIFIKFYYVLIIVSIASNEKRLQSIKFRTFYLNKVIKINFNYI